MTDKNAQVDPFMGMKHLNRGWMVSTPEEGVIAHFKYEDDALAFAEHRGEFFTQEQSDDRTHGKEDDPHPGGASHQ